METEFVVSCENWVNVLNLRFDLHTLGMRVAPSVGKYVPLINKDRKNLQRSNCHEYSSGESHKLTTSFDFADCGSHVTF